MSPSGVVERVLAGRIGLDAATVGEGLIARGVAARMADLGIRDRLDYERALLASGEEAQALVEEVVIPESWFFRDARPFATLRDQALGGWVADPGRPPLRALSVPCAGGEEPYSIAIGLIEAGLPPSRFRVDAVDVSARSVARAVAGVYGSNSFRGVDPPLRLRHFRDGGGASTVEAPARSSVRFHLGNLLDPGLLADRPPFDVVFCRNLLIYLDGPGRAAATAGLARLTADGGLLFLGHADRLDGPAASPFAPLPDRGSFAYRKGPPADPPPAVAPARPPKARPAVVARRRPPAPASPVPGAPPAPKGQGGGPDPAPTPGPAGSALDEASALADSGRYEEASRRVERAIAGRGPTARAYFLLGTIAQATGDRAGAEAWLTKAVYLDAQHDEALLALALLARRRGDVAAEAAYRRRAERVRSRKGAP